MSDKSEVTRLLDEAETMAKALQEAYTDRESLFVAETLRLIIVAVREMNREEESDSSYCDQCGATHCPTCWGCDCNSTSCPDCDPSVEWETGQ